VRLIPECTPDSSHSCRYHPIGIYESPAPLISISKVAAEMSQNQVVKLPRGLVTMGGGVNIPGPHLT